MNKLPKGISLVVRKRADGSTYTPEGTKYRMELQVGGQRYREYFADLGEAIARRAALLETAGLGSLVPKGSARINTISNAVQKYLTDCKGKYTDATVRFRKRVLLEGTGGIPALAQVMGGTPVEHADAHKIYQWLRDQVESEAAPKRYNRFRREVVRFFNWAAGVDARLIDRCPIDRNNVPRRKVAKKERPVPVNGDMSKMKEAALRLDEKAGTIDLDGRTIKAGQYYNFFMLMAGSWARKGELLRLTFNDISWEYNQIRLTTRKGNGLAKDAWQWVPDQLMDILKDQLKNSVGKKFVFENRSIQYRYTDKFGAQLHPGNAWIQRIAKEAGVKVKGNGNEWCSKNISAHSLRHFVASDAFARGENPVEIRDRMRHQNLVTTNIYSRTLKPSTTIVELDF